MTRQQSLRIVCGPCAALLGVVGFAIGSGAVAAEREAARGMIVADKPAVSDPENPSELAREGMAKMLQALNKLVESVPQFEMPQMNENGDIILRRKRPEAAPAVPPAARVPERPGGGEI